MPSAIEIHPESYDFIANTGFAFPKERLESLEGSYIVKNFTEFFEWTLMDREMFEKHWEFVSDSVTHQGWNEIREKTDQVHI